MAVDVGIWQGQSSAPPLAPPAPGAGPAGPKAAARRPHSGLSRLAQALTRSHGRVRAADVVTFMRHLSTLLNAGLQISKALRTLARQFENPQVVAVTSQLANNVATGESLSSAMAQRKDVFDKLTINIVHAGEVAGSLPETLDQLADDMEKKQALRRTVVGAMIYPAIVMVIAAAVVGFLLMFVVPTFEGVYKKMHLELPWITRLLLQASRLVVRLWWAPVLAGAAVGLSWKPLNRIESFRRRRDQVALALPLFGRIRRMAIATQFLSALSTLTGSGVTVVEALRLLSHLMVNVVAQAAVTDIRNRVRRGGKVVDAMERYASLFSPMAVQMIGVGEETGTLPESTARIAEFMGHELETRAKALTTLLEPLLTVGLGAVVGTIALAIYLPMFDLIKHVSH